MKKIATATLVFGLLSTLSAQNLRIVNAASLSSGSVPAGTIVSIFGTQLNTGVSSASNAQTPPSSLGGVTVTVGGTPASLFYVSPTQINAVLGTTTPAGVQTVTVTSAATGVHTGTLTIDPNAAPGLFSLSGTGTRDGAILNAINFLLGDFSIRTGGSPTYLALFVTGLVSGATPVVTVAGVTVPVAFAGPTPCCAGLEQINLTLPDSLAGAGRVPIVVTVNGHASNTVQVVLLPPAGSKQFGDDNENQTRSRELSSLAYVPGTSLILSTDENDDVVRVIDVSARKVMRVIALPSGANPDGLAVNAAGTIAAVAESGRGKVAILNLATNAITTEVATGSGPVSVAIAGTQAVVVNQDADSVSIVDLAGTLQKTLAVGRGPKGVAVDATARVAYVTNEDDGTISVIDLAGLTVTRTITLGASLRPEAIALIPGSGVAFVALPAADPDGRVLLVNLTTGATLSTISANPDRSGGSSDVAFFNSKVYFANQAGGSVSVLPVNAAGQATGSATTLRVDLGARALAIDIKDNLLVVSNEGSGTLVLISLSSNTVVDRIKAVQTGESDNSDDHSDRGSAANAPAIVSIAPASGKAGSTVALTITGTNLTGAQKVMFVNPASLPGNGKGQGKGVEDQNTDSAFTVTNLQVNAAGTQASASVAIAAGAKTGPRLVKVTTANGESASQIATANTFTVIP